MTKEGQMRWRNGQRGERLINDPMNVEIKGETFDWPADITVDEDGSSLRRAIKLMRGMGEPALQRLLGTEAEWNDSMTRAQTELSSSQESGQR